MSQLNIVFLHGWGTNKGIWTSFIDQCQTKFSSNVRFEALNLPGYGPSPLPPNKSYSIDNLANMISAQLLPNTVLVAWSMGGLLAQQIVDTGDKNVVAYLEIASTPKFVETQNWPGIKPDVLATFSQQLKLDHSAVLKRFLGIQCLGLSKPRVQMKLMFDAICQYPLTSPENLDKSLRLLIDTDLRPSHSDGTDSSVSCLRIFGGLDTLVPTSAIANIKSMFPNDETLVIPKASHAPFFSHSIETIAALEAFIKPHWTV